MGFFACSRHAYDPSIPEMGETSFMLLTWKFSLLQNWICALVDLFICLRSHTLNQCYDFDGAGRVQIFLKRIPQNRQRLVQHLGPVFAISLFYHECSCYFYWKWEWRHKWHDLWHMYIQIFFSKKIYWQCMSVLGTETISIGLCSVVTKIPERLSKLMSFAEMINGQLN